MDERSFQRLLRRTVAIPVALLVLLAVVLVVEILSLTSALRWVDHAEEVIADSRELMRNMIDMETAIRGYYLTGNRSFLEPFVASSQLFFANWDCWKSSRPTNRRCSNVWRRFANSTSVGSTMLTSCWAIMIHSPVQQNMPPAKS